MEPDWTTETVAALEKAGVLLVQDGNHGAKRPLRHEIVSDGIPHIRAADMSDDGLIDFEKSQRVADSAWARIHKGRSRGGDVLLSHKGTVGRVASIPAGHERVLCSPQTTFWRSLDPERLDQRYLGIYLRSQSFQAQLRRVMHESDMAPYVSLTAQRALVLKLPPVAQQRAVASVIAALDHKIESDRRVAATARSVLMHVAPRSGSPTPLSAVARFRNGGALTRFANGKGRPVLRIKELRAGVNGDTPRTDVAVRPVHAVSFADLLFSWSGTLLTCRWPGQAAVLNQHLFRVDPLDGYPTWLIEAWIEQHLDAFREIAANKATTMGHIQRHHLDDTVVLVPDALAMTELDATWTPLDEFRMGIVAETASLTVLRDALLPRLVSGQIRVPLSDDPEEMVGAAVEAHEVQEAA